MDHEAEIIRTSAAGEESTSSRNGSNDSQAVVIYPYEGEKVSANENVF